jgi:competence protein ComFC
LPVTSSSLLERIGRTALDLVFPPRCLGCGADGTFLCAVCAASLDRALPPRCKRCWRPGVTGTCIVCQLADPPFDGLRAAFVYQGLARELVQALKYRGMTVLAEPMASLCIEALRDADLDFDVIVPVPLSGLRKRTRGYNQAELLARYAGKALGIPVAPRALERRRHTPPQARSAGAAARLSNVAGAFRARPQVVAGHAVLLIDDVTTTGATFAACAAALREAGTRRIWALAFGRED